MKFKTVRKMFVFVMGLGIVVFLWSIACSERSIAAVADHIGDSKFSRGPAARAVAIRGDDVVMEWNQYAITRILSAGLPAPRQLRAMAVVHVSIHDAVNGLTGHYETYLPAAPPPENASVDGAAIGAAYQVLRGLFGRSSQLDEQFTSSLQNRNILSTDPGVGYGMQAASNIVDLRSTDGNAQAACPYVDAQDPAPGEYVRIANPATGTKNAKVYVDAAASPGGDGSKHAPFRRITDAVNTARVIWQADNNANIEIRVEPGPYIGRYSNTNPNLENLPILLDIPNLKLKGSTSMLVDDSGLPTGEFEPGKESLLKADPPLVANQSLLIITRTDSVLTGQGVEISKLIINVGYSTSTATFIGTGISVEQVQDFTVRNNYMTFDMSIQQSPQRS